MALNEGKITVLTPPYNGGSPILYYEKSIDGGAWSVIPGAAALPISEIIASLDLGTAVEARIRAVNAIGPSEPSAVKTISVPNIPGQIAASGWSWSNTGIAGGGDALITITQPPSDGGAAIFEYQFSLDNVSWTAMSGTSHVVSGQTPGATANCYVRALNALGPGPASAVKTITIEDAPMAGVPAAFDVSQWSIANTGTAGDGDIILTITALPSDNGSALTLVEYNIGGGWVTFTGGTGTPPQTQVVSGLTLGATISANLRATNSVGAASSGTPKSVVVAPTTADQIAPAEWTWLNTGDAGDGEATATIVTPPYNGGATITDYEISVDGGAWESMGGTTATITLLTPGADVDAQVRAVNSAGPGTASAVKTITVAEAPTTWTHVLTVGTAADIVGKYSTQGAIAPNTWQGQDFSYLGSFPSPPGERMAFVGGAQPAGALQVQVDFDGYANPIVMEWQASASRYLQAGTDAAFRTFILGKLGQNVNIRLTIIS